MWKDPIVQEVRKAGEELAKKSNYSLQSLFQNLRNNEKKQAQNSGKSKGKSQICGLMTYTVGKLKEAIL